MHAMHARRASLESQSLLLHLEDACSFLNGVRQRNGQAAWVFYRFYPYLWVIVRRSSWGAGAVIVLTTPRTLQKNEPHPNVPGLFKSPKGGKKRTVSAR